MSFDKTKAMRNAERFLSQGKIRAAIGEYQQVVEHDPKDFSTLNTLGDLHAKNSDAQEAVGCFTQVAEHYNKQGFSQKAIAIYNKISKIEPSSIEVSAKLAQLYQSKGSIAEARRHYTALAEHYQNKGQKIEALAIWKQIAELDPNNTDIYLKIAESCWQEEQYDEAAQSFAEAGFRFVKQEKYEAALTTFSRALEIKENDLRALKGLVKAQIGLGDADDAAKVLEKVLVKQPNNRDILYLLVDCYLETDNTAAAEQAIIKLVEQEPGNYPKFLDLVKIYLKKGELNAATRILSLASEHLLVGGQSQEFLDWTNEVLTRNPEQTEALRLVVRFHSWQRNEVGLKEALERLAETANAIGEIEDERYALSQLILIAPQQTEFARRLQEISTLYGFEAPLPMEVNGTNNEVPQFENFAVSETVETNAQNGQNGQYAEYSFAEVKNSFEFEQNGSAQNGSSNNGKEFEFYNDALNTTIVQNDYQPAESEFFNQAAGQFEEANVQTEDNLNLADQLKLQKELDSIEFYVSQGYHDLAAKSLDELQEQFGWRAQFEELRRQLNTSELPIIESNSAGQAFETTAKETYQNQEESVAPKPSIEVKSRKQNKSRTKDFEDIEEIKSELGFEENEEQASDDYDTHYQLATAYKEMGLMEDAIREFQDAINLVEMNDGTRRFFQCANLLGHCFMEKGMPNAAILWFQRGLQVENLKDEEKHALYYELGSAFEAGGETKTAVGHFEKLYSENVDYRDVSQRLNKLHKQSAGL